MPVPPSMKSQHRPPELLRHQTNAPKAKPSPPPAQPGPEVQCHAAGSLHYTERAWTACHTRDTDCAHNRGLNSGSLITSPSGLRALNSAQDSIQLGNCRSGTPVNSPTIPRPSACCHQLWVSRSYMIMSELRSLPDTPKLNTCPFTRRSKVIPELHNGQKVTATGIPPTVSFTISCHVR